MRHTIVSADGNHVDSGRGVHVSESFRQDVLGKAVREPYGQVTKLPETKTSQDQRSLRAAFRSQSLRRNRKSDHARLPLCFLRIRSISFSTFCKPSCFGLTD